MDEKEAKNFMDEIKTIVFEYKEKKENTTHYLNEVTKVFLKYSLFKVENEKLVLTEKGKEIYAHNKR